MYQQNEHALSGGIVQRERPDSCHSATTRGTRAATTRPRRSQNGHVSHSYRRAKRSTSLEPARPLRGQPGMRRAGLHEAPSLARRPNPRRAAATAHVSRPSTGAGGPGHYENCRAFPCGTRHVGKTTIIGGTGTPCVSIGRSGAGNQSKPRSSGPTPSSMPTRGSPSATVTEKTEVMPDG